MDPQTQGPACSALVEAWRSGDAAAGEALIDRHYGFIHRFFSRRVGPHNAAELTQRTFTSFMEGLANFTVGETARPLLFGIARNMLLRHYRSAQRASAAPGLDPPSVLSPSRVLHEQRHQRLLLRALRSLSAEQQHLIELRYWEGLSAKEIGALTDRTASTVRTQLQRLRLRLRESIESMQGDAHSVLSTIDNLERWTSRVAKQREE